MENKKNLSRKDFLSYSAMIGSAAALGSVSPILSSCTPKETEPQYSRIKPVEDCYIPNLPDKAPDGKKIKVALVGCGGRGSGAVDNIMSAANDVEIIALADVLSDRLESVRAKIKENYNITIPDNMCFIGFDSYKQACDTDADIVMMCTPPVFRPTHYKYAVEKGKNTFLEKPIAIDPAGYRTLLAAAKSADMQGLSTVTGTQRHHQRAYVESYKKIQEGLIGEITGGNVYWNQSMLWFKDRQPKWTNMEWMIRDWVNWKWLSGDHIVEQHVHNIDVFNWMIGKYPVSATGFGSRQRRRTGDQYDNFSIDFDYGNGVHLHSMCRQMDGCTNTVTERVNGTKGYWQAGEFAIYDLQGNLVWKYDEESDKAKYEQHNPYVLEHVNLIEHIRSGNPINQVHSDARSVICGVMGRESAYSGNQITWDEMTNSPLDMMAPVLTMTNVDMSEYTVKVPGKARQ